MDVSCMLFLRKEVKKIGVSPLTSMFFYGENTNIRPTDDFRPEVHDSDGLQLALKSGELLWRPLVNPYNLFINSLRADNIAGFGLIQRDLNFDHYQDLETHYESRPSVWITPKGDWGKGEVELIQIPTESDIHDNIVAMWIPEQVNSTEGTLSYDYTMKWYFPNQGQPSSGRVMATRTATMGDQETRIFLVDFAGAELETIREDGGVEGVVTVPLGCRLVEQHVIRNNETGRWRLVFKIQADEAENLVEKVFPERRQVFELRAFLRRGKHVLTETWSFAARL
jgi:glucans biosynthesis protein